MNIYEINTKITRYLKSKIDGREEYIDELLSSFVEDLGEAIEEKKDKTQILEQYLDKYMRAKATIELCKSAIDVNRSVEKSFYKFEPEHLPFSHPIKELEGIPDPRIFEE